MKFSVAFGVISTVALIYGAANANAQQAQVDLSQAKSPAELVASGRTNMGTADLLSKLGQTQAQLGLMMEQKTAKDEWWKNYVVGVDKQIKELNDRINNSNRMHAAPPQSYPMSHEQIQNRLNTNAPNHR